MEVNRQKEPSGNHQRDDWRDCDISDLCKLQRGFDLTEATRKPGTVPVYSSSGLSYFHNESRLQPPAVITGRKGLLGKVFFVEEPCWPHDTTLWVKDFKGNDPRFVSVFLGQFHLERFDAATSVPTLNRNNLVGVPISLPPPPEQRVIAEALSDVDGLLGELDRLITKKRDLKQAAMQQLLTGQTRLPGFSPTKPQFKQTEVGRIPEQWGLARLADLVDPSRSIRYGIVQPGNYDPQGRYMIRGQDYSEVKGWAIPPDVFRVSPSIEERYRNARVKTGDLIMTIVGYCGHVEMIPGWLDGANLTQTTARIAIQPDKAVSAFCKYVLLSPTGRNQVASYIKGAAQPGLNCGDVEKFLLPVPPLPEQTAIAEVLTEMDAELVGLERRREKTRAIKQAMIQELLTGRTRLI